MSTAKSTNIRKRRKQRANPFAMVLLTALIIIAAAGLVLYASGYRYINTNGVKFSGFVKDGVPASGTIKYADGVSGKLEADAEKGVCTISYSNGDTYEGGIKGILRHGSGKYFKKSTDETYDGDFADDKLSGYAVISAPDGRKYEGETKDGEKSGLGKLTMSDGSYYYGEFKNDMRNGCGEQHNADGSKYFGTFVDDKRQGTETVTFTLCDGSVYTGKCKVIYANGDEYTGDFFNDKKSGSGKYVWADGSSYEGDFAAGVREGTGTYTSASGRTYTGAFKNGAPVTAETENEQ